jgi:hypothetical protein
MEVVPHVSFVSLGLESTGEYCHAERKPDGSLSLQDCIRDPQGKIQRSDFRYAGGQRQRYHFDPDWNYDPRARPYYKAAREAGRQVWTDTYIFLNDPLPPTPGVTCATPVYAANSTNLLGVVSVDFSLKALCSFVKEMRIGREGFATVEEARRDGRLQVIALPDAADLIDTSGKVHRLVPNDRIKDDRIRALTGRLEQSLRVAEPRPQGQVQFGEQPRRFVATYRHLFGENLPNWYVCAVVPEAEIMSGVWRSNRIILCIGLGSLLVAILVSVRVST